MILAIDAGNSRVKWGLHDGHAWRGKGWTANADVAALERAWSSMETPSQILISNVAGDGVRNKLESILARWPVAPHWTVSAAEQCGVSNHYDNPTQLGSDRWAALIAAWKHCASACVVVNAGTAVTVDALTDEGIFLGGMIVPGLLPMQRALAAHASALVVAPGRFAPFPCNTADAIYSGAIAAIAGAVEKMVAALGERQNERPLCLVSGGDAEAVRDRLSVAAAIVDNLVLEGLIEIAQA